MGLRLYTEGSGIRNELIKHERDGSIRSSGGICQTGSEAVNNCCPKINTTYCSPSKSVSELAGSFFVGPLSSAFFIAKLKRERGRCVVNIMMTCLLI